MKVLVALSQCWIVCAGPAKDVTTHKHVVTIWQHRRDGSPALWRQNFLSPFSSNSSSLQSCSWVGVPVWLFPCYELQDQGAPLPMGHRGSGCLHRSCISSLLEAWRKASSQHQLKIQVQIWLVFCWHSTVPMQRFQILPTFWTPMGLACLSYIRLACWISLWN